MHPHNKHVSFAMWDLYVMAIAEDTSQSVLLHFIDDAFANKKKRGKMAVHPQQLYFTF